MAADSMFIVIPHYDSTVCVSISTTRKDQKVEINHNLNSGCLLVIASYPELSVNPLKMAPWYSNKCIAPWQFFSESR